MINTLTADKVASDMIDMMNMPPISMYMSLIGEL